MRKAFLKSIERYLNLDMVDALPLYDCSKATYTMTQNGGFTLHEDKERVLVPTFSIEDDHEEMITDFLRTAIAHAGQTNFARGYLHTVDKQYLQLGSGLYIVPEQPFGVLTGNKKTFGVMIDGSQIKYLTVEHF